MRAVDGEVLWVSTILSTLAIIGVSTQTRLRKRAPNLNKPDTDASSLGPDRANRFEQGRTWAGQSPSTRNRANPRKPGGILGEDEKQGERWGWLAEAVGFEPTVGFHPRSVSNRVLSASQPRFRRFPFSGGSWVDQVKTKGQQLQSIHTSDLAHLPH